MEGPSPAKPRATIYINPNTLTRMPPTQYPLSGKIAPPPNSMRSFVAPTRCRSLGPKGTPRAPLPPQPPRDPRGGKGDPGGAMGDKGSLEWVKGSRGFQAGTKGALGALTGNGPMGPFGVIPKPFRMIVISNGRSLRKVSCSNMEVIPK